MVRRYLVAANWKMNMTVSQALPFAAQLATLTGGEAAEIAVAPPFVALSAVGQALHSSGVVLAAQNCHAASAGAYTGEVSVPMLADVGCRYIIVGHSERRQLLGETDSLVNEKAKAVLAAGLSPILCIGETLEEREQGKTLEIISWQLQAGLAGIPNEVRVVIAYEPIWAIGTGKTATAAQAQEVHAHIRGQLRKQWKEGAERVRILYGGSVKADNAEELMSQADIDGALVGGASLQFEAFAAIIEAAKKAAGRKK
ncbi:MAG: triose-phosphate isomerase [Proteobacteria bacterium]|nr:triose-phosphate isomerase [Cystobacterineae bacterium]MCL2259194.1 triose-phosphate isomerase [Cystobacterineae bacterium]MCL2314451.1 triose-phosphate isomerase [Pseudomonadota bacterium]